MNAQTDYGISGATDLMAALKSVSDVGKRVVDEVSSFAETVLQLAERQDELAVATADKDRAVAEESIIMLLFLSFSLSLSLSFFFFLFSYFLSTCI